MPWVMEAKVAVTVWPFHPDAAPVPPEVLTLSTRKRASTVSVTTTSYSVAVIGDAGTMSV